MATPIPTNRARFLLDEIAASTQGTLARRADGVSETVGAFSDSRAVVPGSVFVALRGEAHDGHRFVDSAIRAGAAVVVVERSACPLADLPAGASVVEVDDTLVAWGALAGAHLAKWRTESVDGRIVAITGSAGKTTTKELTAALLAAVGPTHFTAGNLNNRIGVPAVVFALEPTHRFCVLEMGMSLPGELDAICAFAKPDVSVVVNVGVAHAEGVGGREGVMHEKGAVYRALGPEGVAIVNADDPYVRRAARAAAARHVETFGRGYLAQPGDSQPPASLPDPPSGKWPRANTPHYRLLERTPHPSGGSRVVVSCAGRDLEIVLPLPGEAAAIDLCAAVAAQEAASRELLPAASIERALATVRLDGRGAVRMLEGDVLLLDDSYNANPASMRSAFATLAELAGARRKVAVLGEMKELGALGEEEHVALGDALADARVDLAIGCGGLVDLALARAKERGVEALACASTAEAASSAAAVVRDGDAVLVKGSRSTATERVVVALEARPRRSA